eukprot:6210537-Pleurochrysis_carterae.AAC.1
MDTVSVTDIECLIRVLTGLLSTALRNSTAGWKSGVNGGSSRLCSHRTSNASSGLLETVSAQYTGIYSL